MITIIGGALAGLGAYVLYMWLVPTARPLADTAQVLRHGAGVEDLELSWWPRLRVQVLSGAHTVGVDRIFPASLSTDLHIVARSVDEHLSESMLCSLVGFTLGPVVALLLWLAGSFTVATPVLVAGLCGVIGFFMPTLRLRPRADALRRSLLHALGAFVDGAFLSSAAGEGVEDALRQAAWAGKGWAFDMLSRCIEECDRRNEHLWDGLDKLGHDVGLIELRDLAVSLRLSGEQGAPVSRALAAKARSLRQSQATDIEGRSLAAAERMSYPIAVLTMGCLLYLGYPALANVLGGF